jgi:hypothetical protein
MLLCSLLCTVITVRYAAVSIVITDSDTVERCIEQAVSIARLN